MTSPKKWHVEVVYATPVRQQIIGVDVLPGTTIDAVIRQSGILDLFPEIDLSRVQIGVYGEFAHPHDLVKDHDRVEIYRPLIADPKSARRKRAERAKHRAGGRKKL
jgi:hypothetical protein